MTPSTGTELNAQFLISSQKLRGLLVDAITCKSR